jgi:hypothetical protein
VAHLPRELGFGSDSTCYRHPDEWQKAGVWERLHALLLSGLRTAGAIEWSRAVADSSHVQAKKRAPKRARARVDRTRAGSEHHVLVDATEIPLAWTLTGGNRSDITQLIPLLERIPRCAVALAAPAAGPSG